jgi:hypothetical protein
MSNGKNKGEGNTRNGNPCESLRIQQVSRCARRSMTLGVGGRRTHDHPARLKPARHESGRFQPSDPDCDVNARIDEIGLAVCEKQFQVERNANSCQAMGQRRVGAADSALRRRLVACMGRGRKPIVRPVLNRCLQSPQLGRL